jgi:ArsR family transcriptional regulator, arsenate/arsenite/antimonite-responsive transcriptional repressor
MEKANYLTDMESLFLALSDKTRLRILNLMRNREVSVYYFTEVLGESQPKISRHLAYLRNAGVVSARREGKWMYYKIDVPENIFAENILQDALNWLENQQDLRKDYRKLEKIENDISASKTDFQEIPCNIYVSANVTSREKEELETFLL